MPELVQGSTALISLDANRAAKNYEGAANVDYFTRECEVYARLGEHPHIANLLDIQHQTIFLEKGQCLGGILQQNNTTDEQKINWILELSRGLEYIHSKNIIHADLNAAGIIICRGVQGEDYAKWIDFGGSAIDDHEALVSYDEYSYKRQEHPKPAVSKETDIFAFGCTVFEIETGTPPFYNETEHMSPEERLSYVEEKYQRRHYPSIKDLRFKSIIRSCWQGRYESMEDLLEDLISTIAQQPHTLHTSCSCYGIAAVCKMVWERLREVWI